MQILFQFLSNIAAYHKQWNALGNVEAKSNFVCQPFSTSNLAKFNHFMDNNLKSVNEMNR